MPVGQFRGEWFVLRARALPSRWRLWRANRIADDRALRLTPLRARAPFHEDDDRAKDLAWCVEIPFVDAELAAPEAHHHVTICREAAGADAVQAQSAQRGEQCGRVAE